MSTRLRYGKKACFCSRIAAGDHSKAVRATLSSVAASVFNHGPSWVSTAISTFFVTAYFVHRLRFDPDTKKPRNWPYVSRRIVQNAGAIDGSEVSSLTVFPG